MRKNNYLGNNKLGNKSLFYNLFPRNDVYTRFFSGSEVNVYINDILVPEVKEIGYGLKMNVMPLVGYNSYTVDTFALGTRFVNGIFSLYCTNSDRLLEILRQSKQYSSPFTKEKISSDSPIYDRPFNITITYGDPSTTTLGSTVYSLKGCQVTNKNHSATNDNKSDPLEVVYSFVAKDVQILPSTPSLKNVASQNKQISQKEYFLINYTKFYRSTEFESPKIAISIKNNYVDNYLSETQSVRCQILIDENIYGLDNNLIKESNDVYYLFLSREDEKKLIDYYDLGFSINLKFTIELKTKSDITESFCKVIENFNIDI